VEAGFATGFCSSALAWGVVVKRSADASPSLISILLDMCSSIFFSDLIAMIGFF
jgi:hypothetical protein